VPGQWPRKQADNQRRLCQRSAVPVIGAVACPDITTSHTQKIVNAAPAAGEGDRVHRMLSAMIGAGILTGSRAVPPWRHPLYREAKLPEGTTVRRRAPPAKSRNACVSGTCPLQAARRSAADPGGPAATAAPP